MLKTTRLVGALFGFDLLLSLVMNVNFNLPMSRTSAKSNSPKQRKPYKFIILLFPLSSHGINQAFFGLFQKNSSPKKLKLKEFSKKLKLKFQEKLKNPEIEIVNIG